MLLLVAICILPSFASQTANNITLLTERREMFVATQMNLIFGVTMPKHGRPDCTEMKVELDENDVSVFNTQSRFDSCVVGLFAKRPGVSRTRFHMGELSISVDFFIYESPRVAIETGTIVTIRGGPTIFEGFNMNLILKGSDIFELPESLGSCTRNLNETIRFEKSMEQSSLIPRPLTTEFSLQIFCADFQLKFRLDVTSREESGIIASVFELVTYWTISGTKMLLGHPPKNMLT